MKASHGWLTGTTGVTRMSTGGSLAPRESQKCTAVSHRHHWSHRNVHRWLAGTTGVQECSPVAHRHHGSHRNVHRHHGSHRNHRTPQESHAHATLKVLKLTKFIASIHTDMQKKKLYIRRGNF